MSVTSPQTFPYTLPYVCNVLGTDEATVMSLCRRIGLEPHREQNTGRVFFGTPDLDRLRQALVQQQRAASEPAQAVTSSNTGIARSSQATNPLSRRNEGMSRADLSVIVDSVSNAKEEILKDLSRLLDDKLSGLDEVVVELIRSKSENDALREALKRSEESVGQLRSELGKYKPTAFGFFKKES